MDTVCALALIRSSLLSSANFRGSERFGDAAYSGDGLNAVAAARTTTNTCRSEQKCLRHLFKQFELYQLSGKHTEATTNPYVLLTEVAEPGSAFNTQVNEATSLPFPGTRNCEWKRGREL